MNSRKKQAGVSLLEVLIAVLVLAIGVLGIVALQATALRNSQSSAERSQAVMQTYSIFESVRANPLAKTNIELYNFSDDDCAAPTGGTLRDRDISTWITSIRQGLPDGCGAISCDNSTHTCEVTITWDDSRGVGGSATQTVVTRTGI